MRLQERVERWRELSNGPGPVTEADEDKMRELANEIVDHLLDKLDRLGFAAQTACSLLRSESLSPQSVRGIAENLEAAEKTARIGL